MKKLFSVACLLLFFLCGCSGDVSSLLVDYGTSELYTKGEIDQAISLVVDTFKTFEGCKLYSLTYAGDERSEAELRHYNKQDDGDYAACIVLDSSFRSPIQGGGAWSANREYTWSWIIVRKTAGGWELLTYGYG